MTSEQEGHIDPEWSDLGFPPCPIPPPANPFDEDGYCEFCGNVCGKYHAPWCAWADVLEAATSERRNGSAAAVEVGAQTTCPDCEGSGWWAPEGCRSLADAYDRCPTCAGVGAVPPPDPSIVLRYDVEIRTGDGALLAGWLELPTGARTEDQADEIKRNIFRLDWSDARITEMRDAPARAGALPPNPERCPTCGSGGKAHSMERPGHSGTCLGASCAARCPDPWHGGTDDQ